MVLSKSEMAEQLTSLNAQSRESYPLTNTVFIICMEVSFQSFSLPHQMLQFSGLFSGLLHSNRSYLCGLTAAMSVATSRDWGLNKEFYYFFFFYNFTKPMCLIFLNTKQTLKTGNHPQFVKQARGNRWHTALQNDNKKKSVLCNRIIKWHTVQHTVAVTDTHAV